MKFTAANVPNDEVEALVDLQKGLGATSCEVTDNGDGTSDVLIEFPDQDL